MTKETENDQSDNSELETLRKAIAELKKDNKSLKDARDQANSEKEEAETEAATKAGDIEKIKQQLETKHKKEVDGLKAQLETVSNDLKTIRVDAEISNAISKSNVIPDHVEAVEALLHRKVEYEDGVATIDGKSIADFTKDYFAKAGAVYVNAANNSGAGTTGNDGTKASSYKIPKDASEIDADLMKLAASDPTQFNSIMDQANLPDFKV